MAHTTAAAALIPGSAEDFDPRRLGAACDLCPLATEREGVPVPSEILSGTDVIGVAQEPADKEILAQRPLCGAAGRILDQALITIGRHRARLSTTNVVACKPPGGDLPAYEAKLATRNRKRAREGLAPLPTPTSCCAPRLHRELQGFRYVLPLGSPALQAVVPHVRGGIQRNRGRLIEVPADVPVSPPGTPDHDPKVVPGRRFVGSFNPAAVARDMELWRVFTRDLDRIFRWSEGTLRPPQVQLYFRPEVSVIRALLTTRFYEWRGQRVHVYDVETQSIHPRFARLRCIGIGGPDWALVIPFEPVQWERARVGARRAAEERAGEPPRVMIPYARAGEYQYAPVVDEDGYPLDGIDPPRFDQFYTMELGKTLGLYTPEEQAEIRALLQWWATEPSILKVGWNSGSYDRLTMENPYNLQVTPAPHADAMLFKRSVMPGLQHDLGFTASLLLDMDDWKGDHVAVHAQTDEHLWLYNGQGDIGATANVIEPLYAEIETRGQSEVCRLDHVVQAIGTGIHRNGLLVDQVARKERDVELRKRIAKWLTHSRQLIEKLDVRVGDLVHRTKRLDEEAVAARAALLEGWEQQGIDPTGLSEEERNDGWDLPAATDLGLDTLGFNPLSHPQLRAVLFDEWELPIPTDMKPKELYTKSGEISTGDAILRRLVVDRSIPEDRRRFIHAIRMLRRWAKEWGTYVVPLRMPTGREKLDRGCVVWPDGRVHASVNSHTPRTGRIATSGPNIQNYPSAMKTLIIPGPGHAFLGPDMDQIEMRGAAARWKIRALLEAFDLGLDPYQYVMRFLLGEERMQRLEGGPSRFGLKDFKKKSPFERSRKLYKATHLAKQYGATLETAFRLVTSDEDKETGALVFKDLTLDEFAVTSMTWDESFPEYPTGWATEVAAVRFQGFLQEPVLGRRRDYPNGAAGNLSEIVNFPIQASAASMLNILMAEVEAEIPHGYAGPGTGLVNQVHDQLLLEVPIGDLPRVAAILDRIMNGRVFPGLPGVRFTADVGGRNKAGELVGADTWAAA